jgi:hypothetical protein
MAARKPKSKEEIKKIIERTKPYRWKKGQTGNPNGQPRKLPRLDVILEHVLGYNANEPEASSPINDILTAMLKQAKKGNTTAANLLLDRFAGKVAQRVQMQVGISKEDVSNLFPFQKSEDK